MNPFICTVDMAVKEPQLGDSSGRQGLGGEALGSGFGIVTRWASYSLTLAVGKCQLLGVDLEDCGGTDVGNRFPALIGRSFMRYGPTQLQQPKKKE